MILWWPHPSHEFSHENCFFHWKCASSARIPAETICLPSPCRQWGAITMIIKRARETERERKRKEEKWNRMGFIAHSGNSSFPWNIKTGIQKVIMRKNRETYYTRSLDVQFIKKQDIWFLKDNSCKSKKIYTWRK